MHYMKIYFRFIITNDKWKITATDIHNILWIVFCYQKTTYDTPNLQCISTNDNGSNQSQNGFNQYYIDKQSNQYSLSLNRLFTCNHWMYKINQWVCLLPYWFLSMLSLYKSIEIALIKIFTISNYIEK